MAAQRELAVPVRPPVACLSPRDTEAGSRRGGPDPGRRVAAAPCRRELPSWVGDIPIVTGKNA